MKHNYFLIRTILTLIFLGYGPLIFAACLNSGTQLQILGSGGPGNASGRASSAYLLWLDGRAPIMIDAGSGSKDQFHQSGANLADLELVALSHLHPDHASGLPGILWPAGGSFIIAGPDAGDVFPGTAEFLTRLFGEAGAFPVLNDRTEFEVTTLDAAGTEAQFVWASGDTQITARGVPHGEVPTLAFRVESSGISIAFTSDQNGSDPSFIEFIRDVDYLVIHLAASEDATGIIANLHAKPSVWGQMASAANAGHLVVSHISTSSPQELEGSLAIVKENYSGPIIVAQDLMCVNLQR